MIAQSPTQAQVDTWRTLADGIVSQIAAGHHIQPSRIKTQPVRARVETLLDPFIFAGILLRRHHAGLPIDEDYLMKHHTRALALFHGYLGDIPTCDETALRLACVERESQRVADMRTTAA